MSDVTRILNRVQQGDEKAAEELLPLVYGELRKLAVVRMANEKPGQTLQPTALVHEAWLKIAGDGHQHFANRRHFFKAAATAMSLQPNFRYGRQFAGVDCEPALAAALGAALIAAGLQE